MNYTYEDLSTMTDYQARRSLALESPYPTYTDSMGTVFQIGVSRNSLCLWDKNSVSLGRTPVTEWADALRWLVIQTTLYSSGIIECSDCRRPIHFESIAGSYFAGRYCKMCWNASWKLVASKETYN